MTSPIPEDEPPHRRFSGQTRRQRVAAVALAALPDLVFDVAVLIAMGADPETALAQGAVKAVYRITRDLVRLRLSGERT